MWITRVHFFMESSSTSVLQKRLLEMVQCYEIELIALQVCSTQNGNSLIDYIWFWEGILDCTYIYLLSNGIWNRI